MQFSDYRSFCVMEDCKAMPGENSLQKLTAYFRSLKKVEDNVLKSRLMAGCFSEIKWRECERPYYNSFPSIADMLLDVSLDVPAKSVEIPFESILIKLPATYTTSNIETVLMSATRTADKSVWITLTTHMKNIRPFFIDTFIVDADMSIEDANNNRQSASQYVPDDVKAELHDKTEATNALRLAIGIAILASDPNFVQPIVLNRDKLKYANADEATKAYLENRAARLQGRGYTVGEQLEKELAAESHDVSAHIRRPHMALFWTGKGRETPRLQLRRGCLVKPHDIMKVPTGFMDREPAIENTNDPF